MVELLLSWAGWLVAAIMGIFAVRTTIRFDLNDWLKDRRKRKKLKLRSLCPHADITEQDGQLAVRSTFISPPGTTAYQCQDCRHVTHDKAWIYENTEHWANNPKDLMERLEQLDKLTKEFLGT